jgi:PAS domain S-box-containing protein
MPVGRLGIAIPIMAFILVGAILAWMHVQEQALLRQAEAEVATVRHARVDLAKGFLHLSLGAEPGSPFQVSQGLALLDQAIHSLDQDLAQHRAGREDLLESFRISNLTFRSRLAEWRAGGPNQETKEVALRMAFGELERYATELDVARSADLKHLANHLETRFSLTLGAALALLLALCGALIAALRAKAAADEVLRKSETRLRFALEGASDGIWDIQLDSGKTFLSPRAWEILGFAVDAPGELDHIPLEKVHPEDRPGLEQKLQEHMAGRMPSVEMEVRILTQAGNWIWILTRGKASARDASGNPVRLTGTFTDLTAQKHLEQQLLQSQKLEALGRLAGGVAHDFNNILTAIVGFTELSLLEAPPESRLERNLQEVRKAVERSSRLTHQLLAFARQQYTAPKRLDINDAVGDILRMLRRLIPEDIEISWTPGVAVGSVYMDPIQLDQVLTNLCVNARDSIGGGGRIAIETAAVEPGTASPHEGDLAPGSSGWIALAVSDTGCGMDAATREKIFDPFFTTKELGHGTGLGLATVYGIVHQNQGDIHVYSEPGLGTTFRIYLPRHGQALAGATPHGGSEIPQARGEVVLIVEDDPVLQQVTANLLEVLGYQVLASGSAEAALELSRATAGTIHLLLSDVVMPGMNGPDLVRRIRVERPETRCLLMSGFAASLLEGCKDEAQPFGFLQKPFTLEVLANRVRQALEE